MTLINEIGKLRYLDPDSRVIINSSGVRVCAENGETIAEIPWKQGGRFQKWTGMVSEFLIKDGRLFVKNCLQELVDPSKPEDDGKVFGGEEGFVLVEETKSDRDTLAMPTRNTWAWSPELHSHTPDSFKENLSAFVLGLHRLGVEMDPNFITATLSANTFTEMEVHYTEGKEVQPDLGFSDTTFVFDVRGFQIHLGNVLIKPLSELRHPSRAETWSQKVLHSEWGYRDPMEVLVEGSGDVLIVGNSSFKPSPLLSPRPPRPDSLRDGMEVIPRGSSWGCQERHLRITKTNCLVEWFLEDLEWKYVVFSRDLAEEPDSDVRSRGLSCLSNRLTNIMLDGSNFCDCRLCMRDNSNSEEGYGRF